MSTRHRQRDSAGVLQAVASFCEYYEEINRRIRAGSIHSSVDRGAFVRPQDALIPEIWELLGPKRNSMSYAYGPEAGDYELRALIAEVENQRHGTRYDLRQIIIVPGAWGGVELALEELFQVRHGTKRDGHALVIGPTHYQLFHRAINVLGIDVRAVDFVASAPHVPASTAEIDALLDRGPHVVVVTNPNNPDAVYFPAELMRYLVARAGERGCYVLIDEIQDFLTRPGAQGLGYGPWIQAPHVIRVDSFSKKRGLADYRTGWVIAPPEVVGTRTQGLTGRLSGLMGNAPRAANTAIYRLLELARLRGAADLLAPVWEELFRKEAYVQQRLARMPRVEVLRTEACINTLIRLDVPESDLEVSKALMDRGTLIMPCGGYGYAREDCVLRITFAERWEKLEHALDQLEAFLQGHGA